MTSPMSLAAFQRGGRNNSAGVGRATGGGVDSPHPRASPLTPSRAVPGSGAREKQNVRVVIRVRPLLSHELATGEVPCLRNPEPSSLHAVVGRHGDKEVLRSYNFSVVCGPAASQEAFFDASGVRHLVDQALDGVNGSVFAYGQTGSGKTFSMSGHEERLAAHRGLAVLDTSAGVIPRAVRYLFERIHSESASCKTVVRAAYAEIYNENLYDLLNLTGATLPLRWNSSTGFFIQGMLVVQCDTVEDVLAVVAEGHRNRTVGSHALNLDSSRSHSLLTLMLERTLSDADTGGTTVKRRSKVVFVDLAGSERLKESKSEGLTAVETRQINKSLHVLGKVIAALAERKGGGGAAARVLSRVGSAGDETPEAHIPYRDSKLLMDSLGGTALTVMLACVSPAACFLDETLNTLQYAMRASKIENAPVIHVDTKDALILALRKDARMMRAEVALLRMHLGLPQDVPIEQVLPLLQARMQSAPTDRMETRAQLQAQRAIEDEEYDRAQKEVLRELPLRHLQQQDGGGGSGRAGGVQRPPGGTTAHLPPLAAAAGSVSNRGGRGGAVLPLNAGAAATQPTLAAAAVLRQRALPAVGGAPAPPVRGAVPTSNAPAVYDGRQHDGGVATEIYRSYGAAAAVPSGASSAMGGDSTRGDRSGGRRDSKDAVIDLQQAELDELNRQLQAMHSQSSSAKARASALSSTMQEQAQLIDRLQDDLYNAARLAESAVAAASAASGAPPSPMQHHHVPARRGSVPGPGSNALSAPRGSNPAPQMPSYYDPRAAAGLHPPPPRQSPPAAALVSPAAVSAAARSVQAQPAIYSPVSADRGSVGGFQQLSRPPQGGMLSTAGASAMGFGGGSGSSSVASHSSRGTPKAQSSITLATQNALGGGVPGMKGRGGARR